MTYELHFHPLALKEWKKLPKDIQAQFKKVLHRRLEMPHVPNARLSTTLHNCYKIKLRQAGFRLVYSVEDTHHHCREAQSRLSNGQSTSHPSQR